MKHITPRTLNIFWRSLPWVSFLLFFASGAWFFLDQDSWNWTVSSLASIYLLVLYRILPKTGW